MQRGYLQRIYGSGHVILYRIERVLTYGLNELKGGDLAIMRRKHRMPRARRTWGALAGVLAFALWATVSVTTEQPLAVGQSTMICSASGGPCGLGVTAVRFGEEGSSLLPAWGLKNTMPGLPVIEDTDVHPVYDRNWGPDTCPDGLSDPQTYDYLDCTSPPSGTPAKDWPVIYPAGSPLTINAAVFFSQTELTDPQLTASAVVTNPGDDSSGGRSSLTLAATPLTSQEVNGTYLLTAASLTFQGAMPADAGVDQLTITWTITSGTSGGAQFAAGTSTHPVYVTWKPYHANGLAGEAFAGRPYLSVLDIGTGAVTGLGPNASPAMVTSAIWSAFTGLKISHPTLNPVTGQVSSNSNGPYLTYWQKGYDTIGDRWTTSPPSSSGCYSSLLIASPECTYLYPMLAANSGTCGPWAQFLALMLGFQGISASVVKVDSSGFYYGPVPEPNIPGNPVPPLPAQLTAYMLIGPSSLWKFNTMTPGDGTYPYADSLTVSGSTITVSGSGFSFNPSTDPIAQGQNNTPPPLFRTGDHDIVQTPCGLLDPSYGKPALCSNAPDNLTTYERSAVVGFAVIYELEGHDWVPLPNVVTAQELESDCTEHQCQFRAVPYT